eukprot:TRINITY_DN6141_c0_g3_i3.p1 TRINITY_DN6141_c0_g3~~TRINITY_DN6141_c0_g3_i3.p1  ORF type:complete len:305 (-),score=76.21 TRINITY_DN6141_c0_g3_i3:484-1329(-)
MPSILTKTQRSDGRGPSKLLSLLAGAASVAVVGQVLSQSLTTFALPAGHGRPTPTPSSSRREAGEHRARDDMPRHVLEVPIEEAVEEDVDEFEKPGVRVPYRINFFATPPRSHETANFKYLERKLALALEHVEDRVQQVDIRLTVEEATHKPVPGRHHNVQAQHHVLNHQAAVDDDMQAAETDPLAERRQLAPYHIEVSVQMRHGTIVLSKPKHAAGSFVEAVDHMHDTLKRMMRKEKERHIEKRRHRRHFREQKPHDVEDERLSDADNMALLKSGMEPDF